jgi:hypothetical protein
MFIFTYMTQTGDDAPSSTGLGKPRRPSTLRPWLLLQLLQHLIPSPSPSRGRILVLRNSRALSIILHLQLVLVINSRYMSRKDNKLQCGSRRHHLPWHVRRHHRHPRTTHQCLRIILRLIGPHLLGCPTSRQPKKIASKWL